MYLLRQPSQRYWWPIAIGLVLLVAVWLLLTASSASAKPDVPQPDGTGTRPTAGLAIPKLAVGVSTPIVDGDCSDLAYTQGITVTFADQGNVTATVRLVHNSTNLYVCMIGAKGTDNSRFASVYLDTDNGHEALAEADDYSLQVNIIGGANNSFQGTGLGGYTPLALSGWTATPGSSTGDVAEYQISAGLTGGACGRSFGLAVHHQQVSALADDFGWPDGSLDDSPATWKEVMLDRLFCDSGKIAYVYRRDTATAADFKALLEGAGYTVQLIPQSMVTTTDFSAFDLTIIADDTGYLNQWGGIDVTPIISPNKSIIGLGEGGYAFFGKVGSPVGWPNGWHGPQAQVVDSGIAPSYYLNPNNLSGLLPGPFAIYSAPVNEVGIYLPTPPYPPNVFPIGWEPLTTPPNHASLVNDGCYHLWGFSDGPSNMNGTGQNLFLNAVSYMKVFQCPPRPTPPPDCLTVVKSAQPVTTTNVQPGDVIHYTLSYSVLDNQQCAMQRALLVDTVPDDTLFVPGSASNGITPGFDGALKWDLGPLAPASNGSKTFAVKVLDTTCNAHKKDPAAHKKIVNSAKVQTDIGVFDSNTTTHNVDCPPVTFPNEDPPYAESEIQVYPYPLMAGRSAEFSVQVQNLSDVSQTVTVTFQTSPNRFGIGIPFNALPVPGNPRVITLPPHSSAEVKVNWTPPTSGHYCIQVKVEGTGFAPIYTQRNLDVTENLQLGVEDTLSFFVANPTAATADITLTVVNTCPGWDVKVEPSILTGVGPNSTDVRTAVLHVTPSSGGLLGTGCHIDVQGWIGDNLIGGIRKLDVPPVNLPPANPPWLEKEISTIPTVPISGTVNQLCVELQNPLPVTRVVTVTFKEADFGAGVGFTPRATQVFTLPPNSLNKYCISWTPLPGGTLHRCILVELNVPGYQTVRSQRNLDLEQRTPQWNPGSVAVPFVVGNPHLYQSEVNLTGILIGLNNWLPQFDPPPPYLLDPGETRNVMLHLLPAVQRAPNGINADVTVVGDVVRADVSLEVDGEPSSGFSVEFVAPINVYLPLILK